MQRSDCLQHRHGTDSAGTGPIAPRNLQGYVAAADVLSGLLLTLFTSSFVVCIRDAGEKMLLQEGEALAAVVSFGETLYDRDIYRSLCL